jgi:serine/threonine protein kinase
MNAELWAKVESLFHEALEHSPETRQAFLDRNSCPDSDLRRQVDVLLASEEEAEGFLEVPPIEDMGLLIAPGKSLIGQQFGAYHIVAPLGAGGMGEVYRAQDCKLGRDVAIKVLPHEFACDAERLSRLRREARTLASLNHPNVAAIYGLEEAGEADCLVLELVEGEVLRGPLPVQIALDRACQVAAGLEAAHAKGIIHRDLKPANVMVTPQGTVKVLDFGLAKAIWGVEGHQDLTKAARATVFDSIAGQIVGTPGYMSPEQARGQDVDNRTDIWAFGCLLFMSCSRVSGRFRARRCRTRLLPCWNASRTGMLCLRKRPVPCATYCGGVFTKVWTCGCLTLQTRAERSRKPSVDGIAGESLRSPQWRWRCLLSAVCCGGVTPPLSPIARNGFRSRS